jgi:hypothetical protein
MEKLKFTLLLGAAICFSSWSVLGNNVDVSKLPPPAGKTIDFTKEIKPLLEESCLRCHGPEGRPKGRYRVDSREAIIKGGSSGEPAIIPKESAKSPFIHMVAHLIEDLEMPPTDAKEKKLNNQQISLLRAWIDQGVKWEE